VTICTDRFRVVAEVNCKSLGMPGLPVVYVPHPLGGLKSVEVQGKANAVLEQVIQALTGKRIMPIGSAGQVPERIAPPDSAGQMPERITLPDSAEQAYEEYLRRGWTDGLPILPPTEEAVEKMILACGMDPQRVVASIPPLWGEATVEKIAINAVMAGCLPQYLPVIVAAVEAMADESFNLTFSQATTHPCCPLLIVNGPLARTLSINGASGAFGSYHRANGTIGRAIRLILLNIGGAIPGENDMATQGQPSQFSFCIAENETASPWEPLHVERGLAPSESAVTVVTAENPHNINDSSSTSAEELLTTISGCLTTIGSNNFIGQGGNPILSLSPEHAETIARDGWSKDDVKAYLFEHARVPLGRLTAANRKRFFGDLPEEAEAPVVREAKDLIVIVVGGPGRHSAYLPSSAGTWAVTRPIGAGG
jgi:hypothetical protein